MPQNGYGDDSIDRSTIRHPEDEIVSQDDLCPICHLLLCRPVITSCNHTLCLSCMTHWAKASLESTFTFVPLDEVPQGIAADQIEVKCPMCRQMGSAIADENRERELVQMYPETYEERKEEEREDLESERSNTEVITLYIGNLHRLIDQDETEGPNQHDWMFFMRPSRSDVIREIRVELHPTFTPPVVTFSKPPYEIRRLGWGYFPISAHIILRRGWTWDNEDAEDVNGRRNGMLTVNWALDFQGPGRQGRWQLKIRRE